MGQTSVKFILGYYYNYSYIVVVGLLSELGGSEVSRIYKSESTKAKYNGLRSGNIKIQT